MVSGTLTVTKVLAWLHNSEIERIALLFLGTGYPVI